MEDDVEVEIEEPLTRRERIEQSVKLAPIWLKLIVGVVLACILLYFWNPSAGHKTELAPVKTDTPPAPVIAKKDGRTPEVLKAAGNVCLIARRAKSITDCQITGISQEIDVRAPVYTEQAKPLCDELVQLVRAKDGWFEGTDWRLRIFSTRTKGYSLAECRLSTHRYWGGT